MHFADRVLACRMAFLLPLGWQCGGLKPCHERSEGHRSGASNSIVEDVVGMRWLCAAVHAAVLQVRP